MKNLLEKARLRATVLFLFCFISLSVFGQKNTVIVRDDKGTGVQGITVYLFTTKTITCKCFPLGGCTFFPTPFDASITGNNGHAKFGEKGDPALKASTTYYATIDAKCTEPSIQNQPCNDTNNPCGFSVTWAPKDCKTNDKGKFDPVIITK